PAPITDPVADADSALTPEPAASPIETPAPEASPAPAADPIAIQLLWQRNAGSVLAGDQALYHFKLANISDAPLRVLPVVTNSVAGWGAQIIDETGATITTGIPLDGGQWVEIDVRVTVPLDSTEGETNETTMTTETIGG
ncbi:MAG: hypothetical protein ACR2J8_11235, partial [Thermomicrobiales bacterium]